ncbi:MAG: hypothetical protein CVT80_04710 [Alphaproteobacteria bacterium HGW-Alphaproteobacteria-2]|nr:MAG: hypothetical protein CVT80_04710 [Alphaproteobacteria bacterium HGW-Alphaproteobacteria-2]
MPPLLVGRSSHPPALPDDGALRAAARAAEAAFLAEMLRFAGLGQARAALGGGAGEEQLSGTLARAQAEVLAEAGGIGLAQVIFEALQGPGGRDDAARSG